jgi:hypothetical protein
LRLLNVVDDHTREALAITVDRRIGADATVKVLDRLVAERRTAPRFLRGDNGPELTANALRDWCRFSQAGTCYIEPGSPWQNPYVESFGSRLRDELLAVEAFSSLLEARVLVEDWRIEDNTLRPHSALGYPTPTDDAKTWTTHPERSKRTDHQPGSSHSCLGWTAPAAIRVAWSGAGRGTAPGPRPSPRHPSQRLAGRRRLLHAGRDEVVRARTSFPIRRCRRRVEWAPWQPQQ